MAAEAKKYECDEHVDEQAQITSDRIEDFLAYHDVYFMEKTVDSDGKSHSCASYEAFEGLVQRLDVVGTYVFLLFNPNPPENMHVEDIYRVLCPGCREGEFRVFRMMYSDRHGGHYLDEDVNFQCFLPEAHFDKYFKGRDNYPAAMSNYQMKMKKKKEKKDNE